MMRILRERWVFWWLVIWYVQKKKLTNNDNNLYLYYKLKKYIHTYFIWGKVTRDRSDKIHHSLVPSSIGGKTVRNRTSHPYFSISILTLLIPPSKNQKIYYDQIQAHDPAPSSPLYKFLFGHIWCLYVCLFSSP